MLVQNDGLPERAFVSFFQHIARDGKTPPSSDKQGGRFTENGDPESLDGKKNFEKQLKISKKMLTLQN